MTDNERSQRACLIAAQLPDDPAECLRVLGMVAQQVGEFIAEDQSPERRTLMEAQS
jgi:hypothetical protein